MWTHGQNVIQRSKKRKQKCCNIVSHLSLASRTPKLKIIFLQHYVFWLGSVLQQIYTQSFRRLQLELTGKTLTLDSALVLAYIHAANTLLKKSHHT